MDDDYYKNKNTTDSMTAAAICFGGCIIFAVASYVTAVIWTVL